MSDLVGNPEDQFYRDAACVFVDGMSCQEYDTSVRQSNKSEHWAVKVL